MTLYPTTSIVTVLILGILSFPVNPQKCITSMVGVTCQDDQDCQSQNEVHLYCNKTANVNICSFNDQALIGHVFENWDCPGTKFSAVEWGSPVPEHMASSGLDCMRLCLYTETCFGIVIWNGSCHLKNDFCFETHNLVHAPNAIIGVLKVVREDMRCGCHYPFERKRANGSSVEWRPFCPASHIKSNPYSCCSDKGLCSPC